MKSVNPVLHLSVGEQVSTSLSRAAAAMRAAKLGKPLPPYFGVAFEEVGMLFSVFTPKRWELIGALRAGGAMSIAELARQLKRDYKNVYNDCEKLIEWTAIEKDENGLVYAPYNEIVVDMKLPESSAA